jgi:ribosomal protein S18 acetylase RimI-like enzyme
MGGAGVRGVHSFLRADEFLPQIWRATRRLILMLIERATEVTDELVDAVQSLIPQLGSTKPTPTREQLSALVNSEASILFVARYPAETVSIRGILTLGIYPVPTGIRSIIEDVIVDEKFRRRGIAEALLKKAIDAAREAGAANVSLSANASREAANQLYQKLGFERRDSLFYIYHLK